MAEGKDGDGAKAGEAEGEAQPSGFFGRLFVSPAFALHARAACEQRSPVTRRAAGLLGACSRSAAAVVATRRRCLPQRHLLVLPLAAALQEEVGAHEAWGQAVHVL